MALVLAVGVAGSSLAKVPKSRAFGPKIEPLASYVGQTVCSPAAKPGTAAFASMLLKTYPHTRSLGISRSCSSGGKSEHKEGRAFDWGVSAYDARDAQSVRELLTWLLATDKHGNQYAMARRLGIQYIIWNRRIWGAYSASSGWRTYTGASPHTDHVHFSLSWAGARKKTSFWTKNFPNGQIAPPPAPTRPSPEPAPIGGGRDNPRPGDPWNNLAGRCLSRRRPSASSADRSCPTRRCASPPASAPARSPRVPSWRAVAT